MTKNQHRLRAEQYADTRAGAILQTNGENVGNGPPALRRCRCGGMPELVQTARGSDRTIYIQCRRCGAQTAPILLHWLADTASAIDRAVNEWNDAERRDTLEEV